MRNYTNTLVFENIFDTPPTGDVDLRDLYQGLIFPTVKVVEENCGTTSGKLEDNTYRIVGETELATGIPLSKPRIDQLLASGVYKVAIAKISSCISVGGICKRCYVADFPGESVPTVGTTKVIPPEEDMGIDILRGVAGDTSFQLTRDTTLFKKIKVYVDGVLQTSGYSVSGRTLTFSTPIALTTNVVIKYIDNYYLIFLKYLAKSYSGSIMGIRALVDRSVMPIKTPLLTSLISQSKLELIRNKMKEIPTIPQDYRDYLGSENIPDPVEEALLILALYAVYGSIR